MSFQPLGRIILTGCLLVASLGWAGAAEKEKKVSGPLYATFKTSLGNIVVRLDEDKAPRTVENFVGLATGTKEWTDPKTGKQVKRPLYNGTIFHRVIPNFMIQGGDPLGTGRGGPGYKFDDEFSPDLWHNKPGILSMANAGPTPMGASSSSPRFPPRTWTTGTRSSERSSRGRMWSWRSGASPGGRTIAP